MKIGQSLDDNNILWLEKDAAVTLICSNYSIYSIERPGKNELKKLLCPKQHYSISAEYFKFVWEELTHPHESPEENRRKFMRNKGAVVRGCRILIENIFDSINYSHGNANIRWSTNVPSERLTFVLYKEETGDEKIATLKRSANSISLDSIKVYAGTQQNVYWSVNIDGEELCPRKYISFWTKPAYDAYLNSIQKDLPQTSGTAEWYFMTGFFLEANSFVAEAYEFYRQAAEAEPNELRYRRTLADLDSLIGK